MQRWIHKPVKVCCGCPGKEVGNGRGAFEGIESNRRVEPTSAGKWPVGLGLSAMWVGMHPE